jgi:hypothetical protein
VDCDNGGGITLWPVSWPDWGGSGVMVDGRHNAEYFLIGVLFAEYHDMNINLLNGERI